MMLALSLALGAGGRRGFPADGSGTLIMELVPPFTLPFNTLGMDFIGPSYTSYATDTGLSGSPITNIQSWS